MTHAVFGLTSTLFVFGNSRRFFKKDTQLLRFRLDQTRDRTLFDNGIAAWPETGTEENIGDIAAAAACAIQEVLRLAFSTHLTANGNFIVTRVFATDGTVGIIKHQLNRGLRHRLAGIGATENNVLHGTTAQMLGRRLAHHPANSIDGIGFPTTVRPHNTNQIRGHKNSGWIDKGFKPGQLDFSEPHFPSANIELYPETSFSFMLALRW